MAENYWVYIRGGSLYWCLLISGGVEKRRPSGVAFFHSVFCLDEGGTESIQGLDNNVCGHLL